MESSAARQRGEREASENPNSIGLHRAQELLELLSAAGVDRRPLRAVVPEGHVAVRRGVGLGAEARREVGGRHVYFVYFVKRSARERADELQSGWSVHSSLACAEISLVSRATQAIGLSFHESGV